MLFFFFLELQKVYLKEDEKWVKSNVSMYLHFNQSSKYIRKYSHDIVLEMLFTPPLHLPHQYQELKMDTMDTTKLIQIWQQLEGN